jgi:biotin transport system substrate-specific component
MKNKSGLRLSFIALFAAIICVGCFIRIPLGAIPIVLQNALCILCGVLLGGIWGGAPTALFLLAGLIGLPVYAGGSSGIGVWVGPTGGFLPGYLLGAVIAGFVAGKPSVQEKKLSALVLVRVAIAMLLGLVILYIPGVIHFAHWATGAGKVPAEQSAFGWTMGVCVLPYLPGDLLKYIICLPIAVKIRPVIAQYLYE